MSRRARTPRATTVLRRFVAAPILLLAVGLLDGLPSARAQCAAGKRVDAGSCVACPDGSASDGTAATCTPCTAGQYPSALGVCEDCATGYVCPLVVSGDASSGTAKDQCASGTASAAGTTTCTTCSEGSAALAGAAFVPAVSEACVAFCLATPAAVYYAPGTAASPSTTCPAGCTLTPATEIAAPEAATCTGTATDASHDCAGLFAAAGGTAEADCNDPTGNGAGCTYSPEVVAVSQAAETCAAANTADCSIGFTPGTASSCANEGTPTGCTYIASAAAIPAEPGAASCSNCPLGKTAAAPATAVCADCTAGQHSLYQAATCTGTPTDASHDCEDLFRVAVLTSGSAESDCISGNGAGCTYTPLTGAIACVACEVGFSCAGGVARAPCALGQYSSAGAAACRDCAVGKQSTTSTSGTRICEDCAPGFFTGTTAQL